MALKEVRREQAKAFDETTEVMADAKRRLDDIAGVQRDFFSEASRHRMNRVQTEATLVSELTAKLSAARSVPDNGLVGAWQ